MFETLMSAGDKTLLVMAIWSIPIVAIGIVVFIIASLIWKDL